ncbi:MAG: hypothetical protein S4CHLAM6_10160 [Chlamydiae bacterium]|nr:hypothetical protein [Chlamydiota bacterium]
MKWLLLVVLVALVGLTVSHKIYHKKNNTELDRFALMTITKSGTFLAIDVLKKMTGYECNDHGDEDLGDVNQFSFYHMHLFPKTVKKLFKRDKKLKKILLVRDLRDACVSLTFWVQKDHVKMLSNNDKEDLCKLQTDSDKIRWILNHEHDDDGPRKWGFHLANQADLMCKVMNKKNVLVVRFENLVGSKGGGSDEAQFREVKKIAQFINAPMKNDDEQLKTLALSLFGDSKSTFRKGQIGSWESHFDEDIEALFNEKLSVYQRKLGYK